jgi:hypothetical protein
MQIAVVRFVADELLGFGLDHVEVEGQLYERDPEMIGGVGCDRKRQAVAINDSMIFTPFPRFVGPMLSPPPLAGGTSRR